MRSQKDTPDMKPDMNDTDNSSLCMFIHRLHQWMRQYKNQVISSYL